MIGQRELTFEDYKAILRRRVWWLVVPALLCAAGAYTVSLYIPSRYTSETVVLVEQPTVPGDYVKPVVGGDLSQRLASMREQILSRTRLQQIIETFELYKEDAGRLPMEDLVARLHQSITVTPLTPMAETRSKDLPGFTVSVVASRPELAQKICTEITSIFMQQNVVLRQRRAEDTNQFLTAELEAARDKLNEQDGKLADFKRRYIGELPGDTQSNFSLLTGLASQLEAVTQALNRAQQDKAFAESALSQQLAAGKLSPGGYNPDSLEKQLAALQNQMDSMQGRYTSDHPDVIKIKNQIVQLENRIREAQAAAKDHPAENESSKGELLGEPPQVNQIRAQLHQIDQTIRERTAEQTRIQKDISKLQASLQLSPAVEQQYKSLTRDYQTALNIYSELLKKQSDSAMSTDLERRQQGEQFRVLDPPSLPQRPTFPNRPLFALGGLGGGLLVGLAIAYALEVQDTTLHSDKDVEFFLQLPTLALIPLLESLNGKRDDSIQKADLKQSGAVDSSVRV